MSFADGLSSLVDQSKITGSVATMWTYRDFCSILIIIFCILNYFRGIYLPKERLVCQGFLDNGYDWLRAEISSLILCKDFKKSTMYEPVRSSSGTSENGHLPFFLFFLSEHFWTCFWTCTNINFSLSKIFYQFLLITGEPRSKWLARTYGISFWSFS